MQNLNSIGYLATLVLMCLSVLGLFYGAVDVYAFIALILYGTVSGCYFVYRDYVGE